MLSKPQPVFHGGRIIAPFYRSENEGTKKRSLSQCHMEERPRFQTRQGFCHRMRMGAQILVLTPGRGRDI